MNLLFPFTALINCDMHSVSVLFILYLSGFVVAHNKMGVGDQALRKSSSSTGERARGAGDSRARRDTAASIPVWRLSTWATDHRAATQVILSISTCTVSGLHNIHNQEKNKDFLKLFMIIMVKA